MYKITGEGDDVQNIKVCAEIATLSVQFLAEINLNYKK